MAPFYISLETLNIFLTSWGNHRTSAYLTVSPPCRLLFTVIYASHFIFFPFTTDTSILHSSILSYFSLCMWCVMIHCCLPDILWGILPCHYLILLHIIWPLSICCQHHLISISSFIKNKPLCGPFFHSCYILWWIKVFCWYFYFLILISLKFWRSVAIIATLLACALEDRALVFFIFFIF